MNHYLSSLNSLNLYFQKNQDLVAVSLFSGGGGLDLGLSFAGFNFKYATDLEEEYCHTVKYNFPDCIVEAKDVYNLTGKEIKEKIQTDSIALLAGGPPCQAFSILGKRQSFSDSRGQLVFEFIRLINELKPEAFIFENVPGILSLNNGYDWHKFLSIIQTQTGYILKINKLLNAADYGVPQIRKRIFVIGFRYSTKFIFPSPTHFNPHEERSISNQGLIEWIPSKLALEDVEGLPNHHIRPHGERVRNRYMAVVPGSRDRIDHTDRIHPERPAGTVIVGSKAGGGRPHIHPDFPRHITVREAARLQSFPDWYIFQGKSTAQYRQVGNAVPPLLAFAIGQSIKAALQRGESGVRSQESGVRSREEG